MGDKYGASWIVDAFSRQGIEFVHSERNRSAVYADALPLFSSGRARLLDHKHLITQFAQLERKTTAMGREKIDHPSGLHDDLSKSVAEAMVEASLGDDVVRTMIAAFGPGSSHITKWAGLVCVVVKYYSALIQEISMGNVLHMNNKREGEPAVETLVAKFAGQAYVAERIDQELCVF